MIDLSHPEVDFAVRIVREACQLCSRIQTSMAVQGLTKSDFSPVTVADFAVQALAARALKQAFPEDTLVGEENTALLRAEEGAKVLEVVTRFLKPHTGEASQEDVCAWIDHGTSEPRARFWTLDPVDGTKGYLRGGQYAIALALIEDGQVVLGALGCPNLGDDCQPDMGMGAVLLARRGQGACCSVAGEDFLPLHVSDCQDLSQARILRSVESGHTNVDQIGQIAEALGVTAGPVLMDSQAKYAVLAAGGGEMLFRLLSPKQPDYRERIWDQAAGSIVLEEAGGRITDLKGNPLDFTQGRTLANNTGVFASNARLHDAGLEAIAQICKPA